jgi:hypothetical protein
VNLGAKMDVFDVNSSVCGPGTYKAEVGDGSCLPCPDHSTGQDYGLAECRCNSGYYRAPTDPKNMSCTREPPASLKITSSIDNFFGRTAVGATKSHREFRRSIHGGTELEPPGESWGPHRHSLQDKVRRLHVRPSTVQPPYGENKEKKNSERAVLTNCFRKPLTIRGSPSPV